MSAAAQAWTTAQLDAVDSTDEVEVASERSDGELSSFVTIWGVRVDDAIYVRSAAGPDRRWFVRALRAGTGALRVGSAEHRVRFVAAEHDDGAIDAAYHRKYDRHGQGIVGRVTGPIAESATLRLVPVA